MRPGEKMPMDPETCMRTLVVAVGRVAGSFYKIPTTYCPEGVVRERVFCYELYHQMRCLAGDALSLAIHAELDKAGHPDFAKAHRRSPDFLFHVPGTHSGNTLAVEVKGRLDGRYRKEAVRDIEWLLELVSCYHYGRGAFLVYNHGHEELVERMGPELCAARARPGADRVYLIAIRGFGTSPCVLRLDGVTA